MIDLHMPKMFIIFLLSEVGAKSGPGSVDALAPIHGTAVTLYTNIHTAGTAAFIVK